MNIQQQLTIISPLCDTLYTKGIANNNTLPCLNA